MSTRHIASALALVLVVLVAASPSFAGRVRGQAPDCGTQFAFPAFGSVPGGAGSGGVTVPGTIGLVRCVRFKMPCTLSGATRMGYVVTTGGGAGTQCAAGIYDAGGTLIANSGVQDCAATGSRLIASLSYQLSAGSEYDLCHAGSVAAGMALYGNAQTAAAWNLNNATIRDAANGAQFNDACAGAGAPYACCSGLKTGTCVGLPTTLGAMGVPAAASYIFATGAK